MGTTPQSLTWSGGIGRQNHDISTWIWPRRGTPGSVPPSCQMSGFRPWWCATHAQYFECAFHLYRVKKKVWIISTGTYDIYILHLKFWLNIHTMILKQINRDCINGVMIGIHKLVYIIWMFATLSNIGIITLTFRDELHTVVDGLVGIAISCQTLISPPTIGVNGGTW